MIKIDPDGMSDNYGFVLGWLVLSLVDIYLAFLDFYGVASVAALASVLSFFAMILGVTWKDAPHE